MDLSDPIETIERTLRNVIHDVLSGKFGPNWANDDKAGLGADWANELTTKMKEDQGVDKTAVVYDIPLAYAEFSDLGELLKKHEARFKPIFREWDEFLAYYNAAERFRNRLKHHRDISPTQRSLLVGIAGEIEDAANRWRIGSNLEVKRTTFQFHDYVSMNGKSDERILTESVVLMRKWRDQVRSAIEACAPNLGQIKVKEESYKFIISGPHMEFEMETAPSAQETSRIENISYKGIFGKLRYNSACQINTDQVLRCIQRPYSHLDYELVGKIGVEDLRRWSSERAGLTPASSGSSNGKLIDIEYSILAGKLRVGAANHQDDQSSHLHATYSESQQGFWNAHKYLRPRQLIGFMLGDIAPKAILHLLEMSLTQYTADQL